MSPLQISCIVFASIFGGALLGLLLHAVLPQQHLNAETKDVVKLGMGLVATMTALVLGLLVASAKSSYDAQRNELIQLSANVVLLDRLLAHYGPEAIPAREALRQGIRNAIDRMWPESSSVAQPPNVRSEALMDETLKLSPQNEAQQALKAQAVSLVATLAQTRWLMFAQGGSSIPIPFLVVVVFWLAILFASFGIFAPANATVVAALAISSLSVSGALFLILEIDQPFSGLIRISDGPLRAALAQVGQ